MGFGTVVSHIILFISIVTVAAGFFIVVNNYVQGTTGNLVAQQERVTERIQTDIDITSIDYDNTTSPDTITISATNTGATEIEPDKTDLVLDDLRVSRTERTITIQADTTTGNPGIWDPDEVVEVVTEENLDNGTHTVAIVAPNGVKAEESFST